ncbi:MAG: hypothetical protein H8E36_10315 [Rhodospirillaceae bacterium]|nr:hypothetical protein [Rhodospirillaceae bacterium]MBL6929857.1 hypothetical protein [Rhodospirillales bacterium]
MRLLTLVAILMASVFISSSQTHANAPADLSYTVLRNGDPIGTHAYTFREKGARMVVDINTDIKVKVAFLTVYRFEHKAIEEWHRGKMVSTFSTTNDDGKNHKLKVSFGGNNLKINGDGKLSVAAYGAMPASLWHPDTVKNTALINTLDGKMMAITVDDLGQDQVMVKGRKIAARHYRLSGDLERELWFDPAGTLVQVQFKGDDGSDISYELR